jgi:hypothetical protein
MPKVFWTGGTWDIYCGAYSPEAPHDTPVPPNVGYTRDQGNCDIRVKYERVNSNISLEEVARNPSAYVLVMSGANDRPDCNGVYKYDGE